MNLTATAVDEVLTQLSTARRADAAGLARLIGAYRQPGLAARAAKLARAGTERVFGDGVYVRGLIEFTSFCRNDCFYCGLRRSNAGAPRYRLSREEILSCCREGHRLGIRTFVLQGGEDSYYTDDVLAPIVEAIRARFPDSAVTLSAGERDRASFARLFRAGASRYLLRHETAEREHYAKLHPEEMSLDRRKECLFALKEIGFQTGSGFMVGSPGQGPEQLAADFVFLRELDPQMIGLGPFIPHNATPFAAAGAGDVDLTLFLLSLARILFPAALIPATTALATVAPDGRERGILAGANVVMPNLSPVETRGKYSIYDGKAASGAEAAENIAELSRRLAGIGRRIAAGRGDYAPGGEYV